VQRLAPRRLARWKSGGILLTYSCNAACAHCYENCSPRSRGSASARDVRETLRELKKLGFRGSNIHFAGGEPFYHYRQLIECFEAAEREGMLPLGKLETNAFWCKNDELTRERLMEIRRFGIQELMVSCDVFHQEFVPMERVRRAVRIGREVLGEEAVRVNSQEFFADPVDVMSLSEDEKREVFRDVARRDRWRVVGRAARMLAPLVERHPKEAFVGDHCERKLLRKGSIHIDPQGNVFPPICAGIILGNARKQPLSRIHQTFELGEHPLVKTLAEAGPVPLLAEAVRRGFREDPEGYASKCHMCFEVRRFFWERGIHRDEVGPEEIYTH
jgi:MoaA/NifB/PqqE/SkfB family radical SAM enzyme